MLSMQENHNKFSTCGENAGKNIDAVINGLKYLKAVGFTASGDFENEFNHLISRLEDNIFRIAVVGEFSSGKSTFLNAIMGADVLLHGVKETTATITEILFENDNGGRMVFDCHYKDGSEETGINIDRLIDYTSTASKTHNVANEIERVVIHSDFVSFCDNVVMVDTPGLNGIADNHREKTIDQIKNAHACIYLIPLRGLSETDCRFIDYITRYQHNIIFVQNFKDSLNEFENETAEEKIAGQEAIIRKLIEDNKYDVRYSIVAVSSRNALLAKSRSIEKCDGTVLTDEVREQMYRESNFDEVIGAISALVEENKEYSIQKVETVRVAYNRLCWIEHLLKSVKSENEKREEKSSDSINRQNYSDIMQQLSEQRTEYETNIDNFIYARSEEIKKEIVEDIQALNTGLLEKLEEELKKIDTITEFEIEINHESVNSFINNEMQLIESSANDHLKYGFGNLLGDTVFRIEEYVGIKPDNSDVQEFEFKENNTINEDMNLKDSMVQRIKKELADEQYRQKRIQAEMREVRDKISANQRQISDISSEKAVIDRKKETDIKMLGTEPDTETKTRYEKTSEFHSFLFWHWLTWESKPVSYQDDSARKKWENQRETIISKYKEDTKYIELQEKEYKRKNEELQEELARLKSRESAKAATVTRIMERLKVEQENDEIRKNKLMREQLNVLKRSLTDQFREYTDEAILGRVTESYKKTADANRERIRSTARDIFNQVYNARMTFLMKMIKKSDDSLRRENGEEDLEKIESVKKIMEEYLCLNIKAQN